MSESILGTEGRWVILELLGHRRLAGHLTEVEIAGAGFLKLDIPHHDTDGEQYITQFYAPGSVYGITPTTEEIATAIAMRSAVSPVHPWELRALGGGEPSYTEAMAEADAYMDAGYDPDDLGDDEDWPRTRADNE